MITIDQLVELEGVCGVAKAHELCKVVLEHLGYIHTATGEWVQMCPGWNGEWSTRRDHECPPSEGPLCNGGWFYLGQSNFFGINRYGPPSSIFETVEQFRLARGGRPPIVARVIKNKRGP